MESHPWNRGQKVWPVKTLRLRVFHFAGVDRHVFMHFYICKINFIVNPHRIFFNFFFRVSGRGRVKSMWERDRHWLGASYTCPPAGYRQGRGLILQPRSMPLAGSTCDTSICGLRLCCWGNEPGQNQRFFK